MQKAPKQVSLQEKTFQVCFNVSISKLKFRKRTFHERNCLIYTPSFELGELLGLGKCTAEYKQPDASRSKTKWWCRIIDNCTPFVFAIYFSFSFKYAVTKFHVNMDIVSWNFHEIMSLVSFIILFRMVLKLCILEVINFKINMTLPSYLCKIELENGISHLISRLCINCKYTFGYNSGIFQKYSRMLITQQSECASGMDYSRNLKSQKSDHSVCI